MSQAGVFRVGGVLVGTSAFRMYEGELGIRYDFDQMAQTGDIDIASFERLSLAIEDVVPPCPSSGILGLRSPTTHLQNDPSCHADTFLQFPSHV